MNIYIHTIDGRPAAFDGYQICYAAFFGRPNEARSSLKEIKKDRAITKKNRLRDGYSYDPSEYGHLRYKVCQ